MTEVDILNVKKMLSENNHVYLKLKVNSAKKWFMSLVDSLVTKSDATMLFITKSTTNINYIRSSLPNSTKSCNLKFTDPLNAVKLICHHIKEDTCIPASIIIMDIEISNDIFLLSILNLWKHMNKVQTKAVPNLLLINNLSFHRNIPLDVSGTTYTVGEEKINECISYTNKLYSPYSKDIYVDMVKLVMGDHKKNKVGPDNLSKWIVFFPTREILHRYIYILKKDTDLHIVIFPVEKGHSKAHVKGINGKRLVILTTGFDYLVHIEDVERVYDPMTMPIEINSITGIKKHILVISDKYTSENRLFKITARHSGIKCIRMTTETEYKTYKQLNNVFYPMENIDRNILLFVENNIDFLKIYEDNPLEKVFKYRQESLCQLGNIYKNGELYNLSELGKIALKLNLSTKPSNFLARWICNKLPPFPGIIVASILNSNTEAIMYDRNYSIDNVIINSLNICLEILKHFSTIDIPNKELSQWARDRHLNIQIVIDLVRLIKSVYSSLYPKYEIELGFFNIKTVWSKCIDILLISYNEDMYKLVDNDHYINNKDKTCFISDKEILPENILVFGKKKNNIKDKGFDYQAIIYIDNFSS